MYREPIQLGLYGCEIRVPVLVCVYVWRNCSLLEWIPLNGLFPGRALVRTPQEAIFHPIVKFSWACMDV